MSTSDLRHTFLTISILLVGILFFVSTKLALASQPFERDEGEYAYSASVILDGGIPYLDTYTMKLPGTYYMYALIIALFGKAEAPIRLATMFFGLISAFFIYKIIRLYLDELKSAAGATAFLLCMSTMYNEGLLANSEHFVLLFAMPALYLFLRSSDRNNLLGMFLSGILLCMGMLMKQHGIFFFLFAIFFLFITWLKKANTLHFFSHAIMLTIGFVVPLLGLIYYLKAHGALPDFYYLTVQYGSAYAQSNSLGQGMLNLLSRFTDQYSLTLSLLAVIWLLNKPMKYRYVAFIFFVFSFLAVCPGLIFRKHYFMLLFPSVGVLFAFVLRAIELYYPRKAFQGQAGLIGVLMLVFMVFFGSELLRPASEIYHRHYGNNPFVLMHGAADYLTSITKPGEKVGMFSNEPELYYYARVKAASPFLYTYPLLENHSYAMRMTDSFTTQTDRISPHVFLKSNANLMIYNEATTDRIEQWWHEKQKGYDLATVLVYEGDAPTAKWIRGARLNADTSWRQEPHMEFYIKKEKPKYEEQTFHHQ